LTGSTAGEYQVRPTRDVFTPLGEPDVTEKPNDGEVVYAQGDRVLCRHWNHRDADQTKVGEETRNIVFMLERISETAVPTARLEEAQATLTKTRSATRGSGRDGGYQRTAANHDSLAT